MWRLFSFCFFFLSFFPRVGGTRKDDKHGSKVKGNIQRKNWLNWQWVQQGKDPKALTLFIKVNITVTWHTFKSLALVSGKRVYVLLGPAGRLAFSSVLFFFFFSPVFFLSKALPTCVIVWPLSACLLQSAVLCCSPHPPPTPPLVFHRSLPPCRSYRLAFLLFIFPRASRPRAALSELAHLY